ncbi:hypothetical protein DY000_02040232 [Brassica cretica]|uniref:Uncharacterized protein n=1 Tax=Brassica cretica TaxID=69181 RepID=A0ABQ7BIG8_BRACR|nr:hypothetical protein DY000_02040232 [Brassica cretica]
MAHVRPFRRRSQHLYPYLSFASLLRWCFLLPRRLDLVLFQDVGAVTALLERGSVSFRVQLLVELRYGGVGVSSGVLGLCERSFNPYRELSARKGVCSSIRSDMWSFDPFVTHSSPPLLRTACYYR